MITILYYLVKVVLCSTFLYTYYWFLLRNKQLHQYNRFYLMGISVLSWIVPLIKIQIVKEQVIASPKVLRFANYISENNSLLEQGFIEKTAKYTWDNLLIIIGILISLFFIVRFVKSLWDIRKLIRLYPLKELKGMHLIMTDVKGSPFSFFKYIFWNTAIDLSSDVGKKILAHEVVHIEEKHSVDKLLIELQLLIGWFNPIVWLIRNELYLIHEFIADQKSIENQDSSVLAKLLLASAYPKQQHLLTNRFFYSPIKRRLNNLNQDKKTTFKIFRKLFVFPLFLCMVLSFSLKIGEAKASIIFNDNINIENESISDLKLNSSPKNPIRKKNSSKIIIDTVVDGNLNSNINKNIVWNEISNPRNKKTNLDEIENKANVVITKKTEHDEGKYMIVDDANTVKPVYILNGKKISEKELYLISENGIISDIASINVIKGIEALKKYPDDGKKVVYEITLKNYSKPNF